MALTVTGFSNNTLTYKIAHETNASNAASTDIFGGSGTLYAIDIDNQDASNTAYLKLKITSGTVTVGTTEPDILLAVGPSLVHHVNFPSGLRFSQLSFWVSDDPATATNNDPGTVLLTFLCA